MNILFLVLLLMAALPLVCEPACLRSFHTSRELHIHQNACTIFRNAQAVRDQEAMAGESALDIRRRKRRRVEQAANPPAEPSFSAMPEVFLCVSIRNSNAYLLEVSGY
jgi:hypothetical protein